MSKNVLFLISTPKCDFCSAHNPTWRYPCKSFTMNALQWGSEGDFAACDICHKLIQEDRYGELNARSVNILYGHLTSDDKKIVSLMLARMHAEFARNRTGEPVRIERK